MYRKWTVSPDHTIAKFVTDVDGALQLHQHTISGYVFLINRATVSWSSHKQELMTLSTAEADIIVAMHTAKEAV